MLIIGSSHSRAEKHGEQYSWQQTWVHTTPRDPVIALIIAPFENGAIGNRIVNLRRLHHQSGQKMPWVSGGIDAGSPNRSADSLHAHSFAIILRSRWGSVRGCPVQSSHFSPGAAPQVGQRMESMSLGMAFFIMVDRSAPYKVGEDGHSCERKLRRLPRSWRGGLFGCLRRWLCRSGRPRISTLISCILVGLTSA